MDAFLELHRSPQATGNREYLFQELIEPHPSLAEVGGDRLCSVRVVVILEETGPRILGATLKVPTGANITDNFARGESGNLMAEVDVGEGTAERIVGKGPSDFEPVACHPDTGVPFGRLGIPEWTPLVEVVLRGAPAFPRLRYQHWDVAVSAKGPVALELNVAGALGMLQWRSGRGWLVGPLSDVIDRVCR